jgi:glycosyltransferase involved in cell wall biosynthesis
MKIAYVGRWSDDAGDAIRAKVDAQTGEWRRQGHEVETYGLTVVGYGRRRAGVPRMARAVAETLAVRRAIAAYAPDALYLRQGLFVPSLRPLQRRFASIVEVNGDTRSQEVHQGLRLRGLAGARARRMALDDAAGLVCVSHELAASFEASGKPLAVIANGADLQTAAAPAEPSERPLAVCLIGVPMPWHGLDKLVELARAIPEWDFSVIGAGRSSLPADAPSNVSALDALPRSDYAPLLARADVGIGSLAMHRAGLEEASPLKVREYLAHGLPVIIGFEDTDFIAEQPWFVHRLANTQGNVREGLAGIRSFVEGVRGRRVQRTEIAHLDVRVKEQARLRFIEEVASPPGTSPRRD